MAGIGKSVATRIFSSLLTSTTDVPKEAEARVTRVDEDGVPWVAVAGSDEETPANGSVTSEAQVGQTVRVSVQGGKLSIVGNSTSPSVGGEYVRGVVAPIEELAEETSIAVRAASSVANAANTVAQAAQAIAQATNQHFWHRATDPDEDGAGTGAFVTDEAQETFLQAIADGTEPTEQRPLHNLLMNSEGILLRAAKYIRAAFTQSAVAFYDGFGNMASNIVARFGADGSQIGRDGESHVELDYHSMKLVDKEGNEYFHVSDLRDAEGVAEMVETLIGDGSKTTFNLSHTATSTDYSVTVDGVEATDVSKTASSVVFTTAPAVGARVVLTYDSASDSLKAFTFGTRSNVGNIGAYSVAEGMDTMAAGMCSHAEGMSLALGYVSHSEGGSTAYGRYSHAEGHGANSNGDYSHSEGTSTQANGRASHAEGNGTTARGDYSHAEGYDSYAAGENAHAEGSSSRAYGDHAHAQNLGTSAYGVAQTTIGKYNVHDQVSEYALIIGNGTGSSPSNRSNALTVAWDGTVETALDVPWALLTLDSACHAYNDVSANAPRYRRWGQLVTVTGIIAPTFEVAAGGTLAIATLPAGVRPAQQINVKCQGSNRAQWCLNITAAGVMTASRYGDENGALAMATGIWMPFCVTYLV